MTDRSCVPDAATFARLALPGVAVPVVLELDSGLAGLDPLATYELLARGERHAALLETADAGAGNAEVSIVVPRASRVLEGADVLDQAQAACADVVADIGIDLPGFVGGAVGMLTHEHVTRLEPTVPVADGAHPAGGPEAVFLLVDEFVVFEHRHDRVRVIHTVRIPDLDGEFDAAAAYDHAVRSLAALADRLDDLPTAGAPCEAPVATSSVDVTSNVAEERFLEMVREAREQVRSGECVQIVVSQRFDRPFTGTAEDAYRALRDRGPAPYHVLMRLDELSIVGASPEQLVGVDGTLGGGRIVTHPIAGTRRRGATVAEDDLLAADLEADPKERAEHMMLVDLGRNDVGRVSVPGSVEVTQLADVERFSHVMHLVSRVEGDLRPGLAPVDALRSCFPAGTLTGAPKVRAMQHIARLEPDRRGPYGGVVGYVGHGRMLDMAITIRTIVIAGGIASVQAGAGVVAASSARREYEETREKAAAALEALAAADARIAAAVGHDVEQVRA